MKRAILVMAWLVMLVVFCRFVPLVHIVPLGRVENEMRAKTFDVTNFANQFWSENLVKSFGRATDAKELLTAIQDNPDIAQKKYASNRRLGGGYFYYLRGEGKVLLTNDDSISLTILPDATNAEIVLQTGLIFGDAVRDGTGLLNASDYPDLQDFNNISAELNKLVETHVIPALRTRAQIGATIRFVGCTEVDDESTDLNPLQVVPVQAEFE